MCPAPGVWGHPLPKKAKAPHPRGSWWHLRGHHGDFSCPSHLVGAENQLEVEPGIHAHVLGEECKHHVVHPEEGDEEQRGLGQPPAESERGLGAPTAPGDLPKILVLTPSRFSVKGSPWRLLRSLCSSKEGPSALGPRTPDPRVGTALSPYMYCCLWVLLRSGHRIFCANILVTLRKMRKFTCPRKPHLRLCTAPGWVPWPCGTPGLGVGLSGSTLTNMARRMGALITHQYGLE